MRVVKFGGSSVADVAQLRHVAALVAELRAQGPVAVVVSAMAGVTDALIGIGQSAMAGDSRLPEQLEALALRHYEAWAALSATVPAAFERQWATLTDEAHTLARRAAGQSAPARERLVAAFSGWGERLVVELLAAALREAGVIAEAFDEPPVALSGRVGADAQPEPSALATRAQLLPRLALLVMRGGVPVLPGYIARDTEGALTTLGRNGSDHSAAVIAAALGAERLTIYSDVPGMLTADPRAVPEATLLPILTYDEAQRMASLGAKALHPRTVEPIARWGIPVELRSSATPSAHGTDILPAAAIPRGRVREASWCVAARLATNAERELAEVTAIWLPAWPLASGPQPTPHDCADAALTALPLAELGVQNVTRTHDGVRLLVEQSHRHAATRALHAALHSCVTHASRRMFATLATGA